MGMPKGRLRSLWGRHASGPSALPGALPLRLNRGEAAQRRAGEPRWPWLQRPLGPSVRDWRGQQRRLQLRHAQARRRRAGGAFSCAASGSARPFGGGSRRCGSLSG